MTLVPLSGAVVVPGNLVVQSNVKTIQHPTGGVVAQIPVRNGMRVNAGDLCCCGSTRRRRRPAFRWSASSSTKCGRRARGWPPSATACREAGDPARKCRAGWTTSNVKTLLCFGGVAVQAARVTRARSQKELLSSKVSQLGEEIAGLEAQVASKAKQLGADHRRTHGRAGALSTSASCRCARLTALQRESARIEGERGQLISTIAETKAKVDEAQLQMRPASTRMYATEVVKDLGEAQGKEAELRRTKRRRARRPRAHRDARADVGRDPSAECAHTIGGVIRAGDAVMEVVPDSDDLQIEARLQPNDIDQVRKGQQAFTSASRPSTSG